MPSYENRKTNDKNKAWTVRFYIVTPQGKKQIRLSGFPTKKDAQKAYLSYMEQIKKEEYIKEKIKEEPKKLIFNDLVELYLKNKKQNIKPSSYYDISHKVINRVLPGFSGIAVNDITPAMILDWQNNLLLQYSYGYSSDLRTILSSILKFGERYYDTTNIISKVEPIRRNMEPKEEMQIWTPEEFHQFISFVESPMYKTFFWFLYLSGCRRGEAVAIGWQDIDSIKGIVKIRKSVTNKTDTGNYEITTPKNFSSNREIHLPQFIFEMFSEYRDWQQEHYENQTFVFCGDRPLPFTSIERELAKGCYKSGVNKIRLHDFRHSCASLLLSSGNSIVSVSKHLGHATISQTLDTYAHMMPNDQSKIVESLSTLKP